MARCCIRTIRTRQLASVRRHVVGERYLIRDRPIRSWVKRIPLQCPCVPFTHGAGPSPTSSRLRECTGLLVCHSSVWEGERGHFPSWHHTTHRSLRRARARVQECGCGAAREDRRPATWPPSWVCVDNPATPPPPPTPSPFPVLHRPGWGDRSGSGLPVPLPPSPHLAAAFACPPLSAAFPARQPARPPARLLGRGTPVVRVPAPYCRAQPYGRAQRAGVSRGWRRSVWTRLCLLCRALFWLTRPGRRSEATVSICFRPLLAPPAAPR